MRLDEEVLMDFFREHINVTVSIVSVRLCFVTTTDWSSFEAETSQSLVTF